MSIIALPGNFALEHSTDSGSTWDPIPGILGFNIGNIEAEEIDVTDADSTGNFREFANGFSEASEGSIRLHNKPRDTKLMALRSAVGGAAQLFRSTIDQEYAQFNALVKSYSDPIEIGGVMVVEIGIKLTGAPTYSAVT